MLTAHVKTKLNALSGQGIHRSLIHCLLGKHSADNILKYFSYFSHNIELHILCELSDNSDKMSNPI